jgi:hypothetical protein
MQGRSRQDVQAPLQQVRALQGQATKTHQETQSLQAFRENNQRMMQYFQSMKVHCKKQEQQLEHARTQHQAQDVRMSRLNTSVIELQVCGRG